MTKFKSQLDLDVDDLLDPMQKAIDLAVKTTTNELYQKAKSHAATKLKSGLGHWLKGIYIEQVGSGEWVIAVEGKLANWMEDGIKVGEISKALLGSSKVKTSKKGAKYIDVPIKLDADAMTQSVTVKSFNSSGDKVSQKVSISSFKDANQLVQAMSQGNKDKIVKFQRATQGVIKRVEQSQTASGPKTTSVGFLAIRRISDNSAPWPRSAFSGAKVLEYIDSQIEQIFEKNLSKILERS